MVQDIRHEMDIGFSIKGQPEELIQGSQPEVAESSLSTDQPEEMSQGKKTLWILVLELYKDRKQEVGSFQRRMLHLKCSRVD